MPLVLVALVWFLQRTDAGIAVRGMAENIDRARLLGIPVNQLSMLLWSIAGGLAALTVVLQGTQPGRELRRRRWPAAPAAGAGRGRGRRHAVDARGVRRRHAHRRRRPARGLERRAPGHHLRGAALVVIVGLLVQPKDDQPGRASRRELVVAHRRGPAPARPAGEAARRSGRQGRSSPCSCGLLVVIPLVGSPSQVNRATLAVTFALAAVSLVVLTGWGGVVSLGQVALVGVGGVVTANLIARLEHRHVRRPVLCGRGRRGRRAAHRPAGAAGLGRVPGRHHPGLRRGDAAVHPQPGQLRVAHPAVVRAPSCSGASTSTTSGGSTLLASSSWSAARARGAQPAPGRTGRAIAATRDNERSASAAGINPVETRLGAFVLSGVIAGVAGGAARRHLAGRRRNSYAGVRQPAGLLDGRHRRRRLDRRHPRRRRPHPVARLRVPAVPAPHHRRRPAGHPHGPARRPRPGHRAPARPVRSCSRAATASASSRSSRSSTRGPHRRRHPTCRPSSTGSGLTGPAPPTAHQPPARGRGSRCPTAAPGALRRRHHGRRAARSSPCSAPTAPASRRSSSRSSACCRRPPARSRSTGTTSPRCPPRRSPASASRSCPAARASSRRSPSRRTSGSSCWMLRGDSSGASGPRRTTCSRCSRSSRERWDQQAGDLSGGEQQQLSLAMAFVVKPKLLCIDELSLGLAPDDRGAAGRQGARDPRPGHDASWSSSSRSTWRCCCATGRCSSRRARCGSAATPTACSTSPTSCGPCSSGPTSRRRPPGSAAAADLPIHERSTRGVTLECHQLTKRFGGIRAVDRVDLVVPPSTIVGLIGHNGAGKTTLFDLLTGYLKADGGRVLLNGDDITDLPPYKRADRRAGPLVPGGAAVPVAHRGRRRAGALETPPGQPRAGGRRAAPARLDPLRARGGQAGRRADRAAGPGPLPRHAHRRPLHRHPTHRRAGLPARAGPGRRCCSTSRPPASPSARPRRSGPLLRDVQAETGCSIVVIEHDMALLSALCDDFVALEQGARHRQRHARRGAGRPPGDQLVPRHQRGRRGPLGRAARRRRASVEQFAVPGGPGAGVRRRPRRPVDRDADIRLGRARHAPRGVRAAGAERPPRHAGGRPGLGRPRHVAPGGLRPLRLEPDLAARRLRPLGLGRRVVAACGPRPLGLGWRVVAACRLRPLGLGWRVVAACRLRPFRLGRPVVAACRLRPQRMGRAVRRARVAARAATAASRAGTVCRRRLRATTVRAGWPVVAARRVRPRALGRFRPPLPVACGWDGRRRPRPRPVGWSTTSSLHRRLTTPGLRADPPADHGDGRHGPRRRDAGRRLAPTPATARAGADDDEWAEPDRRDGRDQPRRRPGDPGPADRRRGRDWYPPPPEPARGPTRTAGPRNRRPGAALRAGRASWLSPAPPVVAASRHQPGLEPRRPIEARTGVRAPGQSPPQRDAGLLFRLVPKARVGPRWFTAEFGTRRNTNGNAWPGVGPSADRAQWPAQPSFGSASGRPSG